ncbi:tubulin-like doman-containing protein [Dermatophilaceae bacterium Soc4.6]
MRKILFVGCGGTGGAILAYLMDQLRSDLGQHEVGDLPGGWQFVQIDVPQNPDPVAPSLGTIVDQGGRYVSCAPSATGYPLVDAGVSQQLQNSGGLGAIGTWAPDRPEAVQVPVQDGAGQYRAIGRVLTLSRITQLNRELEAAWGRLSTTEATASMHRAARAMPALGPYAENDTPLVLVVSSMAGGSGASMALDVGRLLSRVRGVDANLVAVFMASADVFESLPEQSRQGVRPNALAMFGEIIASQSAAAGDDDADVLGRLGFGQLSFPARPFARVFPIGRNVGLAGSAVRFGDGTPGAVYRGTGRALAALVSSASALDGFVSYDLGNPQPVATRRELFAWGQTPEDTQWGSFGFGSLSMGRDRYAEYSAQRIARTAVDHLLGGHLQPTSRAGGPEQARALVDSQWGVVCQRLGLPSGTSPDLSSEVKAMVQALMAQDDALKMGAAAVESQLVGHLPLFAGKTQASDIVAAVQAALTGSRLGLRDEVQRAAYALVHTWVDGFVQRVESTSEDAVATHGMPYARTLLERLREHLDSFVAPSLESLGRGAGAPVTVPPKVQDLLARLRGEVVNTAPVVNDVVAEYVTHARNEIRREWCALAAPVLRSMLSGVVDRLVLALSESMALLENARTDETAFLGIARIETDVYRMWPSDDDQAVADRWAEATNEVLVTPSSAFMAQYEHDLTTSLGTSTAGDAPERRRAVVRSVIRGTWPTTGSTLPPGGLLTRLANWRTRELPVNLEGAPTVPQVASYDLAVRPSQLVARARTYVKRPDASFHSYTMLSLREYAKGGDIFEAGRPARQQDLLLKFRQALAMALPLISVDATAVQTLHASTGVRFRYKFSEVPFKDLPELETGLVRVLVDDSRTHPDSQANLERALDGSDVTRLDVFGSYENFAPLVFDGVLRPIVAQWNASDFGARQQFWRLRRTRRLPACLPMGQSERRSMVAGWFLGQMIGRVTIPAPPYDQPVRIWDESTSQWLAFPHPLLTPPERFKALYDWLPAVLESSLLAVARFGDNPVGSSMRPYQTLRRLYDGGPAEPANNASGMFRLAAQDLLASWLVSGQTAQGGLSRIRGVTPASTPDERSEASIAWLATIESTAEGYQGGASSLVNREQAGRIPMFADLAEDVLWACQTLVPMLKPPTSEVADDVF